MADRELAQNSRNNIELDKAMSCYYEVLNYEADTIAKHIKLIVVHAVSEKAAVMKKFNDTSLFSVKKETLNSLQNPQPDEEFSDSPYGSVPRHERTKRQSKEFEPTNIICYFKPGRREILTFNLANAR